MADVELIRLHFWAILTIGSSIQSLIQILYRVTLEGRLLWEVAIFCNDYFRKRSYFKNYMILK